jgi:hypothetical protein
MRDIFVFAHVGRIMKNRDVIKEFITEVSQGVINWNTVSLDALHGVQTNLSPQG